MAGRKVRHGAPDVRLRRGAIASSAQSVRLAPRYPMWPCRELPCERPRGTLARCRGWPGTRHPSCTIKLFVAVFRPRRAPAPHSDPRTAAPARCDPLVPNHWAVRRAPPSAAVVAAVHTPMRPLRPRPRRPAAREELPGHACAGAPVGPCGSLRYAGAPASGGRGARRGEGCQHHDVGGRAQVLL